MSAAVALPGVGPVMNVGNIGLDMDNNGAARLRGALLGSSKIPSGDLPFFIPMAVNPSITNVLSVVDNGPQVILRRSMVDALFYNAAKGILISLVSPIIRTKAVRVNYVVDCPIIHPAQLTTLGTVGQINASESFTIATDARMVGTTLHSALDTILQSPDRLFTEAHKCGISMILTFNQLVIMHFMINGIISLYFIKGAWHHTQEVKSEPLFATHKVFRGMANDDIHRFFTTVSEFQEQLRFYDGRPQAYLLAPLREAMYIAKLAVSQQVKEYLLYLGVTGFKGEIVLADYAPSTRSVNTTPESKMWTLNELSGVILAVVPASRLSRGLNLGNLLETTDASTEFYYHPQRDAGGNTKHYTNQYDLGFYDMPNDRQFFVSMTRRMSFSQIFDTKGRGFNPDYIDYINDLNNPKRAWRPSVSDPTKRSMMLDMIRAPDGVIEGIDKYVGEPLYTSWNSQTGKLELAKNLFGVSRFILSDAAVIKECRMLAESKKESLTGILELVGLVRDYIVNIVAPIVEDDKNKKTMNDTQPYSFTGLKHATFLSLPSVLQNGVGGINPKAKFPHIDLESTVKALTILMKLAEKVASSVYSDSLLGISPFFNRIPSWMPQDQTLTSSAKLVSVLIANFTEFVPMTTSAPGGSPVQSINVIRLKGLFNYPQMLDNTKIIRNFVTTYLESSDTKKVDVDKENLTLHLMNALQFEQNSPPWNSANLVGQPAPVLSKAAIDKIRDTLKLQIHFNETNSDPEDALDKYGRDVSRAIEFFMLVALITSADKKSIERRIEDEEKTMQRDQAAYLKEPKNKLIQDLISSLKDTKFGTPAKQVFTTIVVPPETDNKIDNLKVFDPKKHSYPARKSRNADFTSALGTGGSVGSAKGGPIGSAKRGPASATGGAPTSSSSGYGSEEEEELSSPLQKNIPRSSSFIDLDVPTSETSLGSGSPGAPTTGGSTGGETGGSTPSVTLSSSSTEIRPSQAAFGRRPPGAKSDYVYPTQHRISPKTSDFWQDKNWTSAAWERDAELHANYPADMQSSTGIMVYAYLSIPTNYASLSALTDQRIMVPSDFFVIRPQVNRYVSPMLVADGAMRAFVHPTVIASEFDELRNTFTSTTKARIGMVQMTFPNNFTFRGAFLKHNEFGMSSGFVIDTKNFTFKTAVKGNGLGINVPSCFVLAISPVETLNQGFCWDGRQVSSDFLSISGLGGLQTATDAFSMLGYYQRQIPAFGNEVTDSTNNLLSTVNSFATKNPAKTTVISPVKQLNNLVFTERFSNVILKGPQCHRHNNAVTQENGVSSHGLAKHQREGCRETWIGKRVQWTEALTTPATRTFAMDQN